MLSAQELRDLAAVMRQEGITVYEHGDLRVHLSPIPPPRAAVVPIAPREYTDDELLYAATQGLPE